VGFLIIIIIMVCILFIVFLYGTDIGYKHGQIDAINGNIHYYLIKQSNGEMKWVKQ
jgi:hypothetical protein